MCSQSLPARRRRLFRYLAHLARHLACEAVFVRAQNFAESKQEFRRVSARAFCAIFVGGVFRASTARFTSSSFDAGKRPNDISSCQPGSGFQTIRPTRFSSIRRRCNCDKFG
jgi:hypothetical protein